MRRREYLIGSTVAVTGFAGCVGSSDDDESRNGDANSSEDTPASNSSSEVTNESENTTVEDVKDELENIAQYTASDKPQMLLTVRDFPSDWHKMPDDYNPNFDVEFANEDESILVLVDIDIAESVESAKEIYDRSRAGTRDPQEYDIGDEAFWAEQQDLARTIFRHSNAVGEAVALRESGTRVVPDPQRSQDYARKMFQKW